MKQTIKTFMFAATLTLVSTATFAQQDNNQQGKRPSPEKMMEQRGNSIAQQLGLDAKTTKKFLEVFKSEQNDMRQLMPQRGSMPPRGERPQGGPQNGQQGQGNQQQGERPQGNPPSMGQGDGQHHGGPQMSDDDKKKMEQVKEKYNKKYAKILSKDQISQMNKIQEQERNNRRPGGNQGK